MKIYSFLMVFWVATTQAQPVTKQIVNEALASMNRGELTVARDLLKTAYQADQENIETLYYLGKAYYELGETDSSQYILEEALARNTNDGKVYLLYGKLASENYHHEQAIQSYENSIKLGGSDEFKAEAHALISLAKSEMGSPDEAIDHINEALKLNETAEYYYYRGKFSYQKGRTPKAIRDFDRSVDLRPEFGTAFFWRGIAKHTLMEFKDGCADLERAEELREPNAREMRIRLCQ
jgi:tetratricopeptide (TPR) repeat protein